jgi:cell fate (sporulation/competence/biofilm development) regulator YlbF (YheA/YmcA/DUF963 family)
MEAIKAARELGKAIQADERYKAYHTAKELNDADEGLQATIGEFNLARQRLNMEVGKPVEERDQSKIDTLNNDALMNHARIMDNDNMKRFTAAKAAMDDMIRDVSEIISLCCDGEDPDTCELAPKVGGCGSGGGCTGCGRH